MSEIKSCLITGGTGFLGQELYHKLIKQRCQSVYILSRQAVDSKNDPKLKIVRDFTEINEPLDLIINLAGHPIANARWSKRVKQAIWTSRIELTRRLSQWLHLSQQQPQLIISTSAVGYYGVSTQILDETSPPQACYISELCQAWEQASETLRPFTQRLVILRTGVVLDPKHGMLARLLPVFKLGLGGMIGSGQQGLSWIHRADYLKLLTWLIEGEHLSGIFNATAPSPVDNRAFTQKLAQVLKRPAFCHLPAVLIKALMGEMGQALLLEGQWVRPQRALDAGFTFSYPHLDSALAELLT